MDAVIAFNRYQKFVIALLTFLQFTVILDFMILYPLGPVLIPHLKITAAQFSFLAAVYPLSAGISGFVIAGFADRFDRKKVLLLFYVGFILGTVFCALAANYYFFLFARIITGLFGGVVASVVFTIITDLFSFQTRGRVIGYVQTAFAASQILGFPIGLFFANLLGWRASFAMIVVISIPVLILVLFKLKPIAEHLKLVVEHNAFKHLLITLTIPKYLLAFATTSLVGIGGYMLMPLGGVFTVNNLGISVNKLPIVYSSAGLFAIFIGPILGKISDQYGKIRMFTFGTVVLIIIVIIFTNLKTTPLFLVILVNAVVFVGILARLISSQTLISAIPAKNYRGSFMAANSSAQQIAGGIAAAIAGMIVTQNSRGLLENYDTVGYLVVGLAIVSFILMILINKIVLKEQSLA